MGRFGGAPWALLGLSWELLGRFGVRFWVLWGTLGMLLECFSGCRARATAKTPKTLNLMTFCMDLPRFKSPKASKMKSKWSLRREKRAEKRAPQRRKVLDPYNCLRFQGLGGGQKAHKHPPELLSGRGFLRVRPQNQLFRLGFGSIRDFSENTSP